MRNQGGIVYQASLLPGDLVKSTDGFNFKDRNAHLGLGIRSGLSLVRIGPVPGGTGTRVNVEAYANLSAATDSVMTVEIRVGAHRLGYTKTWQPKRYGWYLFHH